CLWCYTNNTCIDYPVRSILPPSSLCSLSNARWGVCWINFEALIIAIAVVAGLILVSVGACCCYCCYCRRRSRSRPDEEEERVARKREERRLQSLQRKHERKLKHDEIRKKYEETLESISTGLNHWDRSGEELKTMAMSPKQCAALCSDIHIVFVRLLEPDTTSSVRIGASDELLSPSSHLI
ncbi:PREDICTED: pituitary tumor-transforming gene 1 protein-interacting protein-like, partial [Cariama cristata]|uniref:pituitary tumor-transforming gene 1 protein-interacting protein-like n=1 Tax=Cariama cristata TaxID=54380 RepID=UPI0005209312